MLKVVPPSSGNFALRVCHFFFCFCPPFAVYLRVGHVVQNLNLFKHDSVNTHAFNDRYLRLEVYCALWS
jgi:hypothetical protein